MELAAVNLSDEENRHSKNYNSNENRDSEEIEDESDEEDEETDDENESEDRKESGKCEKVEFIKKGKNVKKNVAEKVHTQDEYEHDTSDEEDIRNTVGNIPMKWYFIIFLSD